MSRKKMLPKWTWAGRLKFASFWSIIFEQKGKRVRYSSGELFDLETTGRADCYRKFHNSRSRVIWGAIELPIFSQFNILEMGRWTYWLTLQRFNNDKLYLLNFQLFEGFSRMGFSWPRNLLPVRTARWQSKTDPISIVRCIITATTTPVF